MAILRSSWADLGPSWELLGLSRSYIGGLLGRLQRSETQTGENPKIIQKPMKIQAFGSSDSPGVSLGPLVGYFTASGAVLRPSWEPLEFFLGRSGPSWYHLSCLGSQIGNHLSRREAEKSAVTAGRFQNGARGNGGSAPEKITNLPDNIQTFQHAHSVQARWRIDVASWAIQSRYTHRVCSHGQDTLFRAKSYLRHLA